MLVLSREIGERIVIDGRIELVIKKVSGGVVSIGVEAPSDVTVFRSELKPGEDPQSQPVAV